MPIGTNHCVPVPTAASCISGLAYCASPLIQFSISISCSLKSQLVGRNAVPGKLATFSNFRISDDIFRSNAVWFTVVGLRFGDNLVKTSCTNYPPVINFNAVLQGASAMLTVPFLLVSGDGDGDGDLFLLGFGFWLSSPLEYGYTKTIPECKEKSYS